MVPWWAVKPETILQKSNEFLSLGKKEDALHTLHEFFCPKIPRRQRLEWELVHESMIKRHMELCVTLQKPFLAKEALFKYKAIVINVNTKSLEEVVFYLIGLGEKKAADAKKATCNKATEINKLDMDTDTLDPYNPEELLSLVTRAGAAERSERSILAPWLRFLFECYKQCLELLRNNTIVDKIYHKVAKKGFDFCRNYQRKIEFRKLCDALRYHLSHLIRVSDGDIPAYNNMTRLDDPEAIAALLDTRLYQMDTAIKMELWQEALRSSEDVHMINTQSGDKRGLRPSAVASFYDKLATIFWKIENRLYHAAALFRYYQLLKDMKKSFTAEEASLLGSRIVLAVLSVPDTAGGVSLIARLLSLDTFSWERHAKLSKLLDLSTQPTRQSLIRDISLHLLNNVHPAVGDLFRFTVSKFQNALSYRSLERNYDTQLAKSVTKLLEIIDESATGSYSRYFASIREITALRILQQLSQVYDSIRLDRIQKKIPFFNRVQLELLISSSCKEGVLVARMDHQENCVSFGIQQGFLKGPGEEEKEKMRHAFIIGNGLKMGEDDWSKILSRAYPLWKDIYCNLFQDKEKERKIGLFERKKHVAMMKQEKDYENVLLRKRTIEAYKLKREREKEVRNAQEKKDLDKAESERLAKERERLEEEEKLFKAQRVREEREALTRKMVQDKIESLQKSKVGKMLMDTLDAETLQTIDPDELFRKQCEIVDKENEEVVAKLRAQEKRWDHLVRALHIAEVPLREAIYKENYPNIVEAHKTFETNRVQRAKHARQYAIDTYERMKKFAKTGPEFKEKVIESRKKDFNERTRRWEIEVDRKRKEKLAEREKKRKEKRRKDWIEARKFEEEQKLRDARVRKPEGRPPRKEEMESPADTEQWRGGNQGPLQPLHHCKSAPMIRPAYEPPSETSNWRKDSTPTMIQPRQPVQAANPVQQSTYSAEIDWNKRQGPIKQEPARYEPPQVKRMMEPRDIPTQKYQPNTERNWRNQEVKREDSFQYNRRQEPGRPQNSVPFNIGAANEPLNWRDRSSQNEAPRKKESGGSGPEGPWRRTQGRS